MKVSAIFPTVVIFLGAEALAERCSTSSPAPCECPPGFDYSQPVSFAVVGAHARAVAEGMTDCNRWTIYADVPA
jgi:hypothetical protein